MVQENNQPEGVQELDARCVGWRRRTQSGHPLHRPARHHGTQTIIREVFVDINTLHRNEETKTSV